MGLFGRTRLSESEERRKNSNRKIRKLGLTCFDDLLLTEDSASVSIKDIDDICRRAIGSMLAIKTALDIDQDGGASGFGGPCVGGGLCGPSGFSGPGVGSGVGSSAGSPAARSFGALLDRFGIEDSALTRKERSLLDGSFDRQTLVDLVWSYEAYWSLVWALGLVEDGEMDVPRTICDCNKAISLVTCCENFDDFRGRCRIRPAADILDMIDLYHGYHRACAEDRAGTGMRPGGLACGMRPGGLDPSVVAERRRGLQWLISPEDDWDNISLNT